jgi:hypothetical protein
MAKPIKETPILKGKDAERFIKQNSAIRDAAAIQKEKDRILTNYKFFQAAEKFGNIKP